MSAEEHRQAFLRSLVQLGISNSQIQEKHLRGGAVRTGIISDPPQLDFHKLLLEFYGNKKSFEENLDIEVIASIDNEFGANKLSEPFVLVTFSPSPAGNAKFTPSQEIVKTEDLASIKKKHRLNLYERFRGFGKHYYSLTFTLINVECCDNRAHYRTREEYMNRKVKAHLESINIMQRGFATPHQSRCRIQLRKNINNG